MQSLKPKKLDLERPAIVRNPGLRKKVWERDQGVCAICQRYSPKWQHDHIVSLASGGEDALENSRTLCKSCHRQKTGLETTDRAKADRLAQRQEVFKQRRSIRIET
jgi:5-methylcytosine-specific restriction endonuclease McrA